LLKKISPEPAQAASCCNTTEPVEVEKASAAQGGSSMLQMGAAAALGMGVATLGMLFMNKK